MDEYLHKDRDQKFVYYHLVKVNHQDFNKSIDYINRVFLSSMATIEDVICMTTVAIYNVNYKLAANEDILILPSFDVRTANADGLFENYPMPVLHVDRWYVTSIFY